MELTALNIPDNKVKQLNRAGIECCEDLLAYFPRKYHDRRKITGIQTNGEESVFIFHAEKITNNGAVSGSSRVTPRMAVSGWDRDTGIPIVVEWFNQNYLYEKYRLLMGRDILVVGTLNPLGYTAGYKVTAPAVFSERIDESLGIYPSYKKVAGMAEDYLQGCIYKAAELLGPPCETVPQDFLDANNLMAHADMVAHLHWPGSMEGIEEAQRRQLWDDLLYFAMRIELNYCTNALGSPFNIPMIRTMNKVRESLPFKLTDDQDRVLKENIAWMRSGRRANALIQGDVGSGKTIVALLLMIAFAENGCQAALMAPTQILAKQHHEKLVELVEPYGIKVAFVSGQAMKKAEKAKLIEQIESGEAKLIVGTQALLSDSYKFHRLALVVEDEEHKYGVLQRQGLADKAANGTHMVTMSATPIPRSLAQTIFGENVQLYSIHHKPAGRKPVTTGVSQSLPKILSYIRREVTEFGRQAYVVCPMISKSEKVEGVATAEDTFADYERALAPYGITVALVTGKTKKAEAQETLQAFKENRVPVLVSTTVIEVGVDVPNANCIIIHNAERFGLAQLHQLRGRVGRGADAAMCVLYSDAKDNPRLEAMCKYSDGFKIAEMDLQQRGAGDLLGSQQSGIEKYLAMALAHSKEYQIAQRAARELIHSGESCALLEKAIADQDERIGGEMLS